MKFSVKIAFFSFLIIMTSISLGGFLIIRSTYISELEVNYRSAIDNNIFLSTIYYQIMNDYPSNFTRDPKSLLKEFSSFSSDSQVFIGSKEEIKFFNENKFVTNLKENEQGSQLIMVDNVSYFQVITKLNIDQTDFYIENLVNLSKIYQLRDQNYHSYCLFLIGMSLIGAFMIAIFTIHITKPLTKLKETANMIAQGNFSNRIPTTTKSMQSPEFIHLAKDFNHMADKIENYIEELQEYNRRQEDFISRFTHELKTPLTSMIGYADLLRTYDHDPSKRYELANYIYKEGKRLELLSQHLLQLILLKKEDFVFQKYSADIFFKELKQSLATLLEKYQQRLILKIEASVLWIEPVLLKSLLYNLIDNACKASMPQQEIIVTGMVLKDHYQISVEDFGKGIPKDSIDKVTTPFYMVDKSRARKQGGAGIGLSLCSEIARIHHSKLIIHSVYQKGTTISFEVEMKPYEK